MTTPATNRLRLFVVLALAALPLQGSAADATLRFLEARVQEDPLDYAVHNRLAGLYLRQLRDTGDLAYLDRAAHEARASLAAVPSSQNGGGLTALALTEFESHHFTEARNLAQQAYQTDPRNTTALATVGDAQLELGDYADAEKTYQQLADKEDGPAVWARLSRLAEIKGDNQKAIELLRHDAAQMLEDGASPRDVAWYETRLGELYFRTGDFDNADRHYAAALAVWPESFVALEHIAELRAAQSRYDEALTLYQKVVTRVPRPEFYQALGDVYAFMGKASEAKPWHDRARDSYLGSAVAGNAHYYHHLASFYADSQENATEALKWARKDLEIRHSIYAYDTLAWALYRAGDFPQAVEMMRKALTLGTKDAHLLYHAGMIYSRAGELAEGKSFIKQAVLVNPAYNTFHVHR